ncbi:MAG: hypothetical protein WAQ74_08090 [Kiritimatiellia bacterium]|jgi:hypothetical protein
MMSLRKLVWVAVTLVVTAGVVSADPMRTVFTKENKFPGVWGTEVSIGSGGTYYDDDDNSFNDVDTFQITPAVRFGVTERLALSAKVPYVGYSSGNVEDEGLGDIALGLDFLFFEDIFEYAWILPHAEVAFATGDEDKFLGNGKTRTTAGVSVGTTVNDVVHFAADVRFTSNGARTVSLASDDYDDVVTGALSIVWDLDERASLLGEAQVSDFSTDPDKSNSFRGHVGLSYKINKYVSFMGYGGGSSGLNEDFYSMGRVVVSF